MHKKFLFIISLLALLTACGICDKADSDVLSYVNPFVGTSYNGHTFPGACAPFGYIQASPESGVDDWKYCSEYTIDEDSIMGFSQNHLNGTGCPDLGDILIFPFAGERHNEWKSPYDKKGQKAQPGYYSTRLIDSDISVEITAAPHTAYYRMVYNKEAPMRMLVDLQSGVVFNDEWLHKHVINSEVNTPDRWTITGHQETKNWVQRKFWYIIKFDHSYDIVDTLEMLPNEKGRRIILNFDMHPGDTLQVKVAISTVDIAGAETSMQAESPDWDFDAVLQNTRNEWRKLLSAVEVTGSDVQKENAYTSLYHLYMQPNNIADTDGSYRGFDDEVHVSSVGAYYSTLSLWDTYRAAHPFYTIMVPSKVEPIVNSMLSHAEIKGYLPIWTLADKETHCMIANHAVPVVVEAYMKGLLPNTDKEQLWKAVYKSLTENHKKSDWKTYDKYGYYPYDIIDVESVSRTLESCYDDYCAAILAKELSYGAEADFFMKRSESWKNLYDPSVGLMRARDSQGNWVTPFDPFILSHAASCGGHYTEGNAWQYSWHVQQDVMGLIDLMGGKAAFNQKLDSLFKIETTSEQKGFVSDVSGLIGQYAHGNEPSHHVIYLFNYADNYRRTQELVREVFDKFYFPRPDGLCGNDDCGQMSAWYLFSAMGFYPVDPVSSTYVIGAPQLPRVVLHLENGKDFIMEAKGLSKKRKYIKSVTLNGTELQSFTIDHKDIMDGGHLVFEMCK